MIEPSAARDHCRGMGNPTNVRRRVWDRARYQRASGGERRRLQGEKAALAEVPQVYGRRKIFGWTYQWRRFWRRWQTVILLVMLAVLLGIWLALLQRR